MHQPLDRFLSRHCLLVDREPRCNENSQERSTTYATNPTASILSAFAKLTRIEDHSAQ
jgi:hypothetical protein